MCYNECNMTFNEWLLQKIEESSLSYSEISRRSKAGGYKGISHARISQVVSGEMPGNRFCIAIARGLKIPREEVFRQAGKLDPLPPAVIEEHEVIRILRNLSASARVAALAMLRGLDGSFTLAPTFNIIAEPRATYTSTREKLLIACHRLPSHLQEEALAFVEQLIATTHNIKQLPDGK